MRTEIRTAIYFLMPVFLAAGCSSQKNEQSKNTPPFSIAGGDTEKSAALAETEAEKPWVTFIELGSVNCIPCKMMQPVMKEIEEEYAGQVQVVFYDVWTQAGKPYAEQYRIRAIPTQIFLDSEGKEYSRHEGYFPKEELVKVLKQKGVK